MRFARCEMNCWVRMYRADEGGVSDLVATVRPDIRALLALYCYRRSHLHTRGWPLRQSVTKTI